MSKNKTHKGTKKRIRVTATGKLMQAAAFRQPSAHEEVGQSQAQAAQGRASIGATPAGSATFWAARED